MFSINAENSNCIARMVNDSPSSKANCKIKMIEIDGIPRLCLFAIRDIAQNEELRYNYDAPHLPWRKV